MTSEMNIRDIERHCNNYFNPQNDPHSPERDYPPEFLELADRIRKFREDAKTTGYTSESVVGLHQWTKAVTASGVPVGWQAIFAADLAAYKRVKII